jgi:hypothetical protein
MALMNKEELMQQSVEDLADTILECRKRIEVLNKKLEKVQNEVWKLEGWKQSVSHPIGY